MRWSERPSFFFFFFSKTLFLTASIKRIWKMFFFSFLSVYLGPYTHSATVITVNREVDIHISQN